MGVEEGREQMTQDEIVELMASSRSEDEWNANCDQVKADYDGQYPPFWYREVIMSGLLGKTQAKWEKMN